MYGHAMEPLELLRRAADDQWSMPSICDDWTVKDLADHVLGGSRFSVGMLAGLDAATTFSAALAAGFDDDPVDAYRESVRDQLDAFAASGALDVVVRHPAGDIGARQFLGFRVGELSLHGWDLARSTGGVDTLDDQLVPVVWAAYQQVLPAADDHSAFGGGPSGEVAPTASLSLRLLDLTGRRP
jgi:uncharacterized protein (TIGR03086 family)